MCGIRHLKPGLRAAKPNLSLYVQNICRIKEKKIYFFRDSSPRAILGIFFQISFFRYCTAQLKISDIDSWKGTDKFHLIIFLTKKKHQNEFLSLILCFISLFISQVLFAHKIMTLSQTALPGCCARSTINVMYYYTREDPFKLGGMLISRLTRLLLWQEVKCGWQQVYFWYFYDIHHSLVILQKQLYIVPWLFITCSLL